MENKKYVPLKIVHLILMAAGLSFYIYSIAQIFSLYSDATYIVISLCQSISAVFALISGFLYLVKGYKKNAAAYYKGYVWIILIADMFAAIVGISVVTSYVVKIIWAIGLILLAVLATSKDLGKAKSITIAVCIILCKTVLLIVALSIYSVLDPVFVPVVMDAASQLVLTFTTTFMVCGKYLDKAARGAK